jgi:hypothetical protein
MRIQESLMRSHPLISRHAALKCRPRFDAPLPGGLRQIHFAEWRPFDCSRVLWGPASGSAFMPVASATAEYKLNPPHGAIRHSPVVNHS